MGHELTHAFDDQGWQIFLLLNITEDKDEPSQC